MLDKKILLGKSPIKQQHPTEVHACVRKWINRTQGDKTAL